MNAPAYDWTCQKCGNVNSAHTEMCAKCGFSAFFKVADLPTPQKEMEANIADDQQELGRTLWLFLPEAVPALILAIAAPFWAIRMFANGDVLPAICLVVGELACGYGLIQGYRFSSKWLAYGCMVAFILIAIAVNLMAK